MEVITINGREGGRSGGRESVDKRKGGGRGERLEGRGGIEREREWN